MHYYLIVGGYTAVRGTLHLTDAQAAPRLHALTRLLAAEHGENRYATREPVGFKMGETFGCDAPPPRALAEPVEMTSAQFDKRVKAERESAAADKRQTLAARQAQAEAVRRHTEAKARAAAKSPTAAPTAAATGKVKAAVAAAADAAGSLFAGKPA